MFYLTSRDAKRYVVRHGAGHVWYVFRSGTFWKQLKVMIQKLWLKKFHKNPSSSNGWYAADTHTYMYTNTHTPKVKINSLTNSFGDRLIIVTAKNMSVGSGLHIDTNTWQLLGQHVILFGNRICSVYYHRTSRGRRSPIPSYICRCMGVYIYISGGVWVCMCNGWDSSSQTCTFLCNGLKQITWLMQFSNIIHPMQFNYSLWGLD